MNIRLSRLATILLATFLFMTSTLSMNIVAEGGAQPAPLISASEENVMMKNLESNTFSWEYYVSPQEFFGNDVLNKQITFNYTLENGQYLIVNNTRYEESGSFTVDASFDYAKLDVSLFSGDGNELAYQQHFTRINFAESEVMASSLLSSFARKRENSSYSFYDVNYDENNFVTSIDMELAIDCYEKVENEIADSNFAFNVNNNEYFTLGLDADVTASLMSRGFTETQRVPYVQVKLTNGSREEIVTVYFVAKEMPGGNGGEGPQNNLLDKSLLKAFVVFGNKSTFSYGSYTEEDGHLTSLEIEVHTENYGGLANDVKSGKEIFSFPNNYFDIGFKPDVSIDSVQQIPDGGWTVLVLVLKLGDRTETIKIFFTGINEGPSQEEYQQFNGDPIGLRQRDDETYEQFASRFVDEVNRLSTFYDARIKLDSDVTLSSRAMLKHVANRTNQDTHESNGITIDLNGHNINLGSNTIELSNNSSFRFINTNSNTTSKITGSNIALSVFGNLYLDGGVKVESTGATAVFVMDYGKITLNDGSEVSGTNGIEYNWTGNTTGGGDTYILLRGNAKITATYNGIKFNQIPVSEVDARLARISTAAIENRKPSITATNGIGIESNKNVQFELRDVTIEAPRPIVVSEGYMQINHATLISKESDSPAILIKNNNNENKHGLYIELSTSKVVSNGPIAKAEDGNTLDEFNVMAQALDCRGNACKLFDLNDNYYLFDYVGNAYIIPNNKLSIGGGVYRHNDITNQIDSNMSVEKVTINSNDYYVLAIQDAYAHVSTYDELKSALENPYVQSVEINEDITAPDGAGVIHVHAADVLSNKVLKVYGHTTTDVCLSIDQNGLGISNYDNNTDNDPTKPRGKMINTTDKPLITLNGCQWTEIHRLDLESKNSEAVLVQDVGRVLFIHEGATINGKTGICVDKNRNSKFEIQLYEDVEITGTDGPAIYVKNTGEDGLRDGSFFLINGATIRSSEKQSAIKADSFMTFNLEKADVSGLYGAEMNSGCLQAGKNATISGTKAAIKAGLKNGERTELRLVNATLNGGDYVIENTGDILISVNGGYYYAANENATFMKDSSVQYHNNTIKSGFFSMFVKDEEIGKQYDLEKYKYYCNQIDELTYKLPYVVLFRKLDKSINNLTNINTVTGGAQISVDEELLDHAISESEREALEQGDKNVDVIITVTDEIDQANINKFISGNDHTEFLDYLDIHMNKNVGDEKERVDEVAEFQIISIEMSNYKKLHSDGTLDDIVNKMPSNVVIHHRHGDVVSVMKKVSEKDGRKLQEECYFVTNGSDGKFYINLVTRRFSTFAFGLGEADINPEPLKQNVKLMVEGYSDRYISSDNNAVTATVKYGNETDGYTMVGAERVNVVYEGINNTVYYSETFPSTAGEYRVIVTVKDTDNTLSGSGSKIFTIVDPCKHESNTEVVDEKHKVSDATCTNKAVYKYTCSACSEILTETFEYGEPLGHNFENYASDNNATCTKDGTKTAKCSRNGCNETDTVTDSGTAKGHTFSNTYSFDDGYHWFAATCEHTGEKSQLAEHTYDKGTVTKAPTHMAEGSKLFKCTLCDNTKTESVGKSQEHTFDKEVIDAKHLADDATCTNKALYYYGCECGEVGTDTFENGEALGHSFENYASDNNATCTKDGTKTATCSRENCSETNTVVDSGSAKGHNLVLVEGSISQDVVTKKHYVCSDCDELFKNQTDTASVTERELKTTVEAVKNEIKDIAKGNGSDNQSLAELADDLGKDVVNKIIKDELVNNIESTLVESLKAIEETSDSTIDDTNKSRLLSIDVVGYTLNSDNDVVLEIGNCKDEEKKDSLLENASLNEKKYLAFSVSLYNKSDVNRENPITELRVPLVITIKVPKGMNKELLQLFHKHGSEYTQISFTLIQIDGDDYIRFEVSGLSDFVLVEKAVANPPVTPDSKPSTSTYVAPKTGVDR